MKKSLCVYIAIIIIIIPLLFLLCGCSMLSEQPDKEEYEQYLYKNSDDFNAVLNYLIGQNSMVYFVYDGVEFENWFDTDVPRDVVKAIKRLKHHKRIIISKNGNTIFIELWHPFMMEKSSGLAYSINGVDVPEVGYTIEMTPISEPGWYYYVYDFNAWRSENRDTDIEKRQGTVLCLDLQVAQPGVQPTPGT